MDDARPWPGGSVEQIAALMGLLSAAFPAARAELVRRHRETLVLTGETHPATDRCYAPVPQPV